MTLRVHQNDSSSSGQPCSRRNASMYASKCGRAMSGAHAIVGSRIVAAMSLSTAVAVGKSPAAASLRTDLRSDSTSIATSVDFRDITLHLSRD